MTFGVIAEEVGDVDVLYELTSKLISSRSFAFKHFVGHGGGKLRRKCSAWTTNLIRRGCRRIIVLHDLDDEDEGRLRMELTDKVRNCGCSSWIVLIPIYEIEAWLLTDAQALATVFGMRRPPRLPGNPETVRRPKEYLRDIVWRSCKKIYVNSIHNKRIAEKIRLRSVNRCLSFSSYPGFVRRSR